MKPIKKPSPPPSSATPVVRLPFEPTAQPGHGHVIATAQAMIGIAETLFQGNPAPVLAALTCAARTYTDFAQKSGSDAESVEALEQLGQALAKELIRIVEEQQSAVTKPDTRLVGPDGRPLG